jgi:hypothetical protein
MNHEHHMLVTKYEIDTPLLVETKECTHVTPSGNDQHELTEGEQEKCQHREAFYYAPRGYSAQKQPGGMKKLKPREFKKDHGPDVATELLEAARQYVKQFGIDAVTATDGGTRAIDTDKGVVEFRLQT